MRYNYRITEEETKQVFSNLFHWEEKVDWDDENKKTIYTDVARLTRNTQDKQDVVIIQLKTVMHAMILFDYLSYDRSEWDYEPKLEIYFPNGSCINYNRRGNYGHAGALEVGDYLIICNEVKKALDNGALKASLIYKNNDERVKRLTAIIDEQNKRIADLTNRLAAKDNSKKPVKDDLPF